MLLIVSNDYALLENEKIMKGWKKSFTQKKNPEAFSFPLQTGKASCSKAAHAKLYNQSSWESQFQRHLRMSSVWLTFGVQTAVSRAEQEICCIPKWRDRSMFCTSEVHLVNSWDVQIIINKFRDVVRILIFFKHGVCVLAYFPLILSSS